MCETLFMIIGMATSVIALAWVSMPVAALIYETYVEFTEKIVKYTARLRQ